MRKFNGVLKAQSGLYLKECEWRFNNSDPKKQLQQMKQEKKLRELSGSAPDIYFPLPILRTDKVKLLVSVPQISKICSSTQLHTLTLSVSKP